MARHINELNIKQFTQDIENAFLDIPFGPSKFEIENFVINAQLLPERAFRSIGQQMLGVIQVIREAMFETAHLQVDIDELAEVIAVPGTPSFTKRRAEIDIEIKTFKMDRLNKVIADGLVELNILFEHFERLPEFTREDFEAAEPAYHNERLSRDFLKGVDVSREVQNIRQKNPALEKRRDNGSPIINGGPR